MTGLFRLKRDDSRWKIFCFTGISVIAISYLPSVSHTQAKGSSQSTIAPPSSNDFRPESIHQADDLLDDPVLNTPQMTTSQIEQARATLIRRGFSPIQADTLLPMGERP